MAREDDIKKADKNVDDVFKAFDSGIVSSSNYIEREINLLMLEEGLSPIVLKSRIQDIVRKSGYSANIRAYLDEGYQGIINESFNLYENLYDQRFNFSEGSLEGFALRQGQDLVTFETLETKLINDLNKQLVNSQMSGLAAGLTSEATGGIINVFSNNSTVELETSVARTYRASNRDLAQDNGIEEFFYAGPSTGNIRPFCLAHVGKTRTMEEWNSLDNGKGQPKPVSEYQGGYRCRHSFVGVLEDG